MTILFNSSTISWVPSFILPARLSVTIKSSSAVEKLHLNAMSPGSTSTPTPFASNGPRPVYTSYGSYPSIERCAVSLPGIIPGAIESIIPVIPSLAIWSMFGVFAASRGVLLSSSLIGRSPIPSIINTIPFIKYHLL